MDPSLMGQFNQLKGLILQVKKGTDTLVESLQTVDFCCDMFDRSDTGLLNGYWGDGREDWTIRDGILVQQSAGSIDDDQIANSDFFSPIGTSAFRGRIVYPQGFSAAPDGISGTTGEHIPVLYKSAMSSPNLIIELGFQLSSTPSVSGTSIVTHHTISQMAGIAVADESGRPFGVSGIFIPSPGWGGGSSYSLPSEIGASIAFSNGFNVVSQILQTKQIYVTPTSGQSDASWYYGTGSSHPFRVGSNSLSVAVTGGRYVVRANGSLLVERNSITVLAPSRVGLFAWAFNQMSAIETYGFPYAGITYFKAWPIGMPEPPNQTGHGVYVDNAVKYTDKYHDSDGNYNPEA